MTALIFDSDGGIDDAAALWHVCGCVDFNLLAVTVCAGNVGVQQAAANLATVLSAAGRAEVPVALGPAEPIGPHPPLVAPTAIHGHDGLGDTGRPTVPFTPAAQGAVNLLIDLVTQRPGEVTVVAVGPLTNIAAAILSDPDWAGQVDRLVFMGGSAQRGGNARPLAEANIAHDPQAAQIVAQAAWARPPVMVGLDVTYAATLGEDLFALLAEGRNPAARFLAEPLAFYRRVGSQLSDDGLCPCHDLLATMVAQDPDIVTTQLLAVEIDTGASAAWGATVVDTRAGLLESRGFAAPDPGRPRMEVAMAVDVDRFRANARALFGG